MILVYVAIRFQWKLALGSVIAAMHDPIVVLGFFAATQMTFDLPTLAAILAVVGYCSTTPSSCSTGYASASR